MKNINDLDLEEAIVEVASHRIHLVIWGKFVVEKYLKEETIENCIERLIDIQDSIELMHDFLALEDEDKRSGEETYGYEPDDIKGSLEYISDRWKSRFRLRWLLDLIKLYKKKSKIKG